MPSSRSAATETVPNADGVTVERRFTEPGKHPFDAVEWEIRDASSATPQPAFEQRGVEFPETWSQNATNIVGPEVLPRARRLRRARVARSGRWSGAWPAPSPRWGREGGYFATADDADAFEAELTHILLNQMAAFNSPVWFNVGFEEHPQCSACFILSVEDTMESILDWNTTRGQDLPRRLGLGHQPLQHPRARWSTSPRAAPPPAP